MPLDKLVERILQDAREEAARLEEEAALQRDELLEAAEREADTVYRAGFEAGRRAAEQEKRRRVTSEQLNARKSLLEERQGLMREAFGRALQSISGLPEERYLELMAGMLSEAAGDLEGDVILSPRDRERLGEELVSRANRSAREVGRRGELTLSEETREMEGGFVVRSGGVEINNSLEAHIGSRREELEPRVAGILFEEPG